MVCAMLQKLFVGLLLEISEFLKQKKNLLVKWTSDLVKFTGPYKYLLVHQHIRDTKMKNTIQKVRKCFNASYNTVENNFDYMSLSTSISLTISLNNISFSCILCSFSESISLSSSSLSSSSLSSSTSLS